MGDNEFILANTEALQAISKGMTAFSFGVVFKLLVYDISSVEKIPAVHAEIALIVGVSESQISAIFNDIEWVFSVRDGVLIPNQNYLLKGDSDGQN